MHIAVDAHNLLIDRRGISVYLRAILSRALKRDAYELTLLVRHPLPIIKKRALTAQLGSDAFKVAARVPRDADVVWHPWNGTFFFGGRRNAVTMHDVAPFAFPDSDPQKRQSQQEPFRESVGVANRILTDSAFSKNEIVSRLSVEPSRIEVIPLAPDEQFSPGEPAKIPAALVGRPYILYVGTLDAQKNVDTLARAWRTTLAPRGVQLAVVGNAAPEGAMLLRNVSSIELRDIYRAARCLAFPSLYEGFGLPPLEAMACGTPVITTRCASLPEVCGDAAFYVEDPRDPSTWDAALVRVLDDAQLRRQLRVKGLARAATFSWNQTAQETLRALIAAAA